MKKTLALLLALLLVLSLAACGGKDKAPAADKGSDKPAEFAPVAGETYDTGAFTVTVPKGWLAVPLSDLFDEYEGDTNPNGITLVKDGKEEWDSLDHAWVRIDLYEKDGLYSAKALYDDVKDLAPVSASGFNFSCYSCTSSDYPYIIMEGTNDKNDLSISLLTKNGDFSLALEDADVQTIIRSVAVK